MSSHDDYSSDEESINETTKTDVFLGFVDIAVDEITGDDELPSIEDSFLGGSPYWLHPDSKPDEKLVTCDSCGAKMAMYLQAYSPFEGNFYDRVIYIFGCKNTAQCSKKKGSIKAFRGIRKDPIKIAQWKKEQEEALQNELEQKLRIENKKKMNIELTKDLFKTEKSDNPFGGNPFGGNPFDNPFGGSSGSNGFPKKEDTKKEEKKTFASVVAQNAPQPKLQPKLATDLPQLKGYLLYVDKEKFKKVTSEPELEKYRHLINENNVDGDDEELAPSSSKTTATLNPQASKITNMLDDPVFENFSNTVQHNPTQVLRYDLGGRPLLYSGKDHIASVFSNKNQFGVPAPAFNPSSSRQFELQLMPKAIMDLESEEEVSITNGMSWGTIIVCTDVEDYMPPEYFDSNHVAYVEEWCGVQWEESV